MQTSAQRAQTRGQSGFTLWEVLVAIVIVGVLALGVLSAILMSKVQLYKDRERALVLDFAVHYLETLRGVPFSELNKGAPINALYNGVGADVANVRVPSSFTWFSLNNSNYTAFHPEIALLSTRNPEMRVDLAITSVGGTNHTKTVTLEFRWDPPLNQGPKQRARLDAIRTMDLK